MEEAYQIENTLLFPVPNLHAADERSCHDLNGDIIQNIEKLYQTAADRRACELILMVLDQLCSCAEGRAEVLRHGAGLAIVSKKILRVSHAESDKTTDCEERR
ncbi:hypothetical protein DH2020_000496 [Rehmannia glutinosa]|uniref:U-box domain-containing protein n=1 Tax=Rehmannia glutinosa TaxID=99300 RepID=A0ABR0XWN6_REHGL